MIQPYELLGVTIHSSIRDVRKAYYGLAQFCHPDKGGNVADMQILHAAYQWIIEQLSAVEEHNREGKTFEEYLAEQKNTLENSRSYPDFDEIFLETSGVDARALFKQYAPKEWLECGDKFLWFKRIIFLHLQTMEVQTLPFDGIIANMEQSFRNMETMSLPHGYGSDMSKPEVEFHSKVLTKIDPEKVATWSASTAHGCLITQPKELEDYTKRTDTLHMSDYKNALSQQTPATLEEAAKDLCPHYFEEKRLQDMLEEMELARKMQDQSFESSSLS